MGKQKESEEENIKMIKTRLKTGASVGGDQKEFLSRTKWPLY